MARSIILSECTNPILRKAPTGYLIDTSVEGRDGTRPQPGNVIFNMEFDSYPNRTGDQPWPAEGFAGFTHHRNAEVVFSPDTGFPDAVPYAYETTDDPDKAFTDGSKSFVTYRESHFEDPSPSNNWNSDGILDKYFPDEASDELYVKFHLKFQPGWTESGQSKIFRLGHYDGTGDFFKFFNAGNSGPVWVWAIVSGGTYGVRNLLGFRGAHQSDNFFMVNPPPVDMPYEFNTGDISINFDDHVRDLDGDGVDDQENILIDRLTGQPLVEGELHTQPQIFGDGEWNKIEFHVKMNSAPGAMDGIAQQWINDQLVFSNKKIPWLGNSSSPGLKWNTMAIGGNKRFTSFDNSLGHKEWYAISKGVMLDGLPAERMEIES